MLASEQELQKAHIAYKCGEMPETRWTKKAFESAVAAELGYVPEWVRKMTRRFMFEYLKATGVYLTGNRYSHRHTVFYALDRQKIRSRKN